MRFVLAAGMALALTPVVALAQAGQASFEAQCAVCHAEGGGQGPSLAGVVGRKAGSAAGFAYSAALGHAGFTWDAATLDRYLADPQALVPGTKMPVQVTDAAQRREIVAYLGALKPKLQPAPVAKASGAASLKHGDVVVFGDWRLDAPGVRHRITTADLPAPFATPAARNGAQTVRPMAGALPKAPAGVKVTRFATLDGPRRLAVAPNGDVFAALSDAGRLVVLRAKEGADTAEGASLFAEGLQQPFGIAFYPQGPEPRFVYVAETNRVVRFPYRSGQTKASGEPQVVVARLAPSTGGHVTRDIAFSPDGKRMFVSVGSGSNVAERMGAKSPAETAAWARAHALGAAWGAEENRADVLAFTPDGGAAKVYATGLRNCVGLAVQPKTGDLWCSTNERDNLGDNLVPDYITRVREGAFYGWPWWYLGDHEDPRRAGERPDLKGHVTTPDVLLQPHSASLQMTFYDGVMFPQWRGSALAAEHGSWNRTSRTGYKLIRAPVKSSGEAEGGYEDVLTGFVLPNGDVWGRPVGVAVAHDGAILVSDDASNSIWRLAR